MMIMSRRIVVTFLSLAAALFAAENTARPHIVLVMADDMGWGETGYYHHPVLKTPHLDAMAAAGLRFDRFYAGAPNCSPTRSTVMTGRSNDRCGVENHGFALRRQEKTLPRALRDAGYRTAHFGKWHLHGFKGPGAPVLATDDHNPGEFGFDEWLSVSCHEPLACLTIKPRERRMKPPIRTTGRIKPALRNTLNDKSIPSAEPRC